MISLPVNVDPDRPGFGCSRGPRHLEVDNLLLILPDLAVVLSRPGLPLLSGQLGDVGIVIDAISDVTIKLQDDAPPVQGRRALVLDLDPSLEPIGPTRPANNQIIALPIVTLPTEKAGKLFFIYRTRLVIKVLLIGFVSNLHKPPSHSAKAVFYRIFMKYIFAEN